MTSYSAYPDQIDAYGSLPLVRDGIDEIRARNHNSLRDAIIKIQQELGIQPSGSFATVGARLDDVADAKAQIEAHLIDPTDAHDASAVSIEDASDNYIATEVEGALGELASVLPERPDVVGYNNTLIPNTGIPSFVGGTGRLHVYNTTASGSPTILQRSQPIEITGVHIFDVGENNGTGSAELKFTTSPTSLAWKGPGDSAFGTAVDVSSATAGELVKLESPTNKGVRVSVDLALLPSVTKTDAFELTRLSAVSGNYSLDGDGIKDSAYITRVAVSSTDLNSRLQFAISGAFYPADRGTLVLQRKLRLASDEFSPIAILNLEDQFDESKRETGQLAYTPSLTGFDTISLFDVHSVRRDYDTLDTDADGNAIYENYDVAVPFTPYQIGKYLIPASNDSALVTGGTLGYPANITEAEVDGNVSAYRMVHYISGVTDFNGEPSASEIFSISDPFAGANDGDSNVRMSNVFVDISETRPGFASTLVNDGLEITSPTSAVTNKFVSGIRYFNSSDDLFEVEVESDTEIFNNTYLKEDILRFESNVFMFPSGSGYGSEVDVSELKDTLGVLYSDSNLPDHTSVSQNKAFYTIDTTRRVYPDGYQFSTRARVTGTFWDPFGPGDTVDAYGNATVTRILVNSFNSSAYDSNPRADETTEYFTDEDFRLLSAIDLSANLPSSETDFSPGGSSFDSTVALSYGELQVGGLWTAGEENYPGLIMPQDDYSSSTAIMPVQSGTTDYSDGYYETESTYIRLFNLGFATNGGRLRIKSSGSSLIGFEDMAYGNTNRSVRIDVRIPGSSTNSTGWLDIGRLFQVNHYDDDDGALNGSVEGSDGDFTVPFTFGVRNTGDMYFMIAVRIIFSPDDTNIADAKNKILSYMELLPPVTPAS